MKRKNDLLPRKRLHLAIISLLSMGVLPAGTTVLAAEDEETIEEIRITGSRVRATTGMTTPTPVTAVTQDELVSLNPASTLAEQLDKLPQFFNTQTAQRGGTTFTTASGSFLNLRSMGTQRTLVLLDGSRVIPADAGGATNIDNFPTALMTRVDVMTQHFLHRSGR